MSLFLVAIIVTGSIRKEVDAGGVDYLSVQSTSALRGLMAVAIILHHLANEINEGLLFSQMVRMGYLIVAVFFFLSGYGLRTQQKRKTSSQKEMDVWLRRIIFLLIIYFATTILYTAFYTIVEHQDIGVSDLILSLANGKPIPNSIWYLAVLILLYLLYWIFFGLFKSFEKSCLFLLLSITVMNVCFIRFNYPYYWYYSNYAFLLGTVWSEYKVKIDGFLKSYYYHAFVVGIAAFALFYVLPVFVGYDALCRMIVTVIFPVLLVLILYKISISCKVWVFIGRISLEIYLLHVMVYTFMSGYISNHALWVLGSLLVTIPVAYIASMVTNKLRLILNQIHFF